MSSREEGWAEAWSRSNGRVCFKKIVAGIEYYRAIFPERKRRGSTGFDLGLRAQCFRVKEWKLPQGLRGNAANKDGHFSGKFGWVGGNGEGF